MTLFRHLRPGVSDYTESIRIVRAMGRKSNLQISEEKWQRDIERNVDALIHLAERLKKVHQEGGKYGPTLDVINLCLYDLQLLTRCEKEGNV